MKRLLVLLLVLLFTVSALAGERETKRALIAELMEVIDVKTMTQASFDALFVSLRSMNQMPSLDDIPAEYRAEFEARKKKEEDELRAFRERLFTRMDYGKYSEEVYVPLFDEHFTSEELQELIVFFKTKAGQKVVSILPGLGFGGAAKGRPVLMKAVEETSEEMEKEEAAKSPWRPTMADMRTIATALEARATDTNEYPEGMMFEQLESILAPTYIRNVPKVDFWGTPYFFVGNKEHYRIVSAGADRRFEWSSRQLSAGTEAPVVSKDLDGDIVYQDGMFIQQPEQSHREMHQD